MAQYIKSAEIYNTFENVVYIRLPLNAFKKINLVKDRIHNFVHVSYSHQRL